MVGVQKGLVYACAVQHGARGWTWATAGSHLARSVGKHLRHRQIHPFQPASVGRSPVADGEGA